MTELQKLRFRAILNGSYHEDAERFFDRVHRWLMLIVVASGSGAVVGAVAPVGFGPGFFAAMAALAGLVDLVFDLFGKAALHKQLRWRALDIYADSFAEDASPRALEARLARLFPDEPPTNTVLNAQAYNRASEALGGDPDERYVIPSTNRLLRHWTPWMRREFKSRREHREEAAAKLTHAPTG